LAEIERPPRLYRENLPKRIVKEFGVHLNMVCNVISDATTVGAVRQGIN
jgi:hypothetical protein